MNTKAQFINYSLIIDELGNHEIIGTSDTILFNNIKSILDADINSLVFIGNERKDKDALISNDFLRFSL